MKYCTRLSISRLIAACLLAQCLVAQASYSCFVSQADSLGVVYPSTNSSLDNTGNVVLTCSRNVATDASTMSYSIKVNTGQNFSSYRRVKLVTAASYLKYTLSKSTAAGTAATCGTPDTWTTTGPITGTLNFGTAASASVTWGYCLRVRRCKNTAGNCNPAAPSAGAYTDQTLISATYGPSSVTSASTPITYTVGVTSYCELSKYFAVLPFAYTAFGPSVTATNIINLQCSNNLPWTLALSPKTSVLQGLQYTLGLSVGAGTPAASVTGAGTGSVQAVTLTGTMPGGQAGSCSAATGTCTSVQQHTLTLSY